MQSFLHLLKIILINIDFFIKKWYYKCEEQPNICLFKHDAHTTGSCVSVFRVNVSCLINEQLFLKQREDDANYMCHLKR